MELYKIKIEKLGPVGMVEFLRQFYSGYGDYTKERDAWFVNLSVDEICNEITVNKNLRK